MTNEERDLISQFISRVSGAPAASGFAQGGSVPAAQPPLPPVDGEANGLITQMFQRYPESAYRMTQVAFVQEQGLIQAQSRIQQLESQLAQARQAAQQAQSQPRGGGGFFSNLFGCGQNRNAPPPNQGAWGNQQGGPPRQQQYAPPPPPQYAPGYQPGMFQSGGSGFLGSALTTAAGVAGGMVVGSMLTNMFTGGHHGGSGFGGMGGTDQGGWSSGAGAGGNQDYVDSGSWDQPAAAPDSSWTDNNTGGGGGGDSWDSGGGGGGGGSDSDSF